jgi:Tol biopolymer transport system component
LNPVWSADGRKLLFNGAREARDLPGDAFDWWVAPSDEGPAAQTGALAILRRQGIREGRQFLSSLIAPADWIADEVFFSGGSDQSTSLWRISLPQATGIAQGSAQKLTAGTSIEAKPSVLPGGRIAFASLINAVNVWSLPIAANSGRVAGGPHQVTNSAFDARTSVSADGKKLVFISTRLGNPDVWLKDLDSGKETAVTATPVSEEEAEISADGTSISYVVIEGSRGLVYQIPTSGGPPEEICDDCGRPWDWSPNRRALLYLIVEGSKQAHATLGLFDVATGQRSDYLVDPEFSLARARFSPDGRWVSFMAFNPAGSHLVVVPYQSPAARKDQWISITEHRPIAQDKPRWSPDGNLLYYLSEVDGFQCIWAQRLDPVTKRPAGQPLPISHWHSARRSLQNVQVPLFQELSLTADKMFFNVGETTGNIWMAEWKP